MRVHPFSSPITTCFVRLALLVALLLSTRCDSDDLVVGVDVAAAPSAKNHQTVTYNQRSFIIHGKPTLLLSGSIHYVRVPPSDWNNVFRLAKELGLNCIQTYVIWSEHEPTPGNIQWEGYGDLVRFVELAAENDLYVVLRLGPYICGEYYFGGIPLWMRHTTDSDGKEIDCFRCNDSVWKREMTRWISIVALKVKPLLASNGGPIIFLQVENEYDKDDEYLEWAVSMARNITLEVPWSICGHNITQCNQLNRHHNTGAPDSNASAELQSARDMHGNKVVCTVNGFWVEQGERGSQPGPEFFQKLWSGNPTQPAVWTEDQGWFDIWGMGHRVRSTSDQIYGMARFFAYGGAYHNFYMLTGGNNYGLRAGRDATTAYAPDTVIDNLLLRHEPRFSSFQKFFHVVGLAESELLRQSVPVTPVPLNASFPSTLSSAKDTTAELHKYGSLAFLSNFGETSSESGYFDYKGESYFLPNHTVVILNTTTHVTLFNTSAPLADDDVDMPLGESTKTNMADWKIFQEGVGYGAIRNIPQTSPEQLNITENKSDYIWYNFYTNKVGKISIKAIGWGGLHYSYVNGVLSDTIRASDWNVSAVQRRLRHSNNAQNQHHQKVDIFSVAMGLSNQKKRVDILSVGMGLSTSVSPQDGKGIESVTVGEGEVPHTIFATAWKLKGEELEIFTDTGAKRVEWESLPSRNLSPDDGLLWLQGTFDAPKELLPFLGGAQPNQTALVINLSGLYKGMAYVNGFNIGRYWLVPGKCPGKCAPPRHGKHCFLHYEGCGKPTQHLYHVPFEIVKATENTITLFEESASSKPRNLNDVFLEVIHKHPHY